MPSNDINDICTNEEYADIVSPLYMSEYESFKEDIKPNGVQVPIITNQDIIILDGHQRYRVWVIDHGRPATRMPKPTVLDHSKDKL